MKSRHGWFVGLAALTMIVVGTANADAQAPTANGPYYPVPSWDQTFPSAQRFLILSNFSSAAILDRETGLVWERSPEVAQVNWYDAAFACLNRTTGGRKAWRLPSIHELQTLVDPSVTPPAPALPPGHPFLNVAASNYQFFWSGTTNGNFSLLAWGLFLGGPTANQYYKEVDQNPPIALRAWCVRGASAEHHY